MTVGVTLALVEVTSADGISTRTGGATADGVAVGGITTDVDLVNFAVVLTAFVAKESSSAQVQTS